MSNFELKLLVCKSVKGQRREQGYDFSHKCAHCNADVQVSPAGQEKLKTMTGLTILCFPCGMVAQSVAPAGSRTEVGPDAKAAIERLYGIKL